MRTILLSALLFSTTTAIADEKPSPQLQELRKWIGKWSGKGSITTEGKTHAIAMNYDCEESAGAAGVRCRATITGIPGFTYQFDDLWGYSTVENLAHWYVVTNAGEVHDHRGHLDAAGGFFAVDLPTEGKLFSEQITFKRKSAKATVVSWVSYVGTTVRERGEIELGLK